MTVPIALSVSDSDASGVSGIQSDLKTFEAAGVYGTAVVTAVRVRDASGLRAVHEVPATVVREQLEGVLADFPPDAVEVGALTTVPVVRLVAMLLGRAGVPLVLDPSLFGRSGERLLRPASVVCLVRELLPLAAIVMPSLPEASALAGFPIRGEAEAKTAARKIQAMGARAVLIKGGQAEGPIVVDGLLDGRTWWRFAGPRFEKPKVYGAGTALAAAVTAQLARGETLPDAVEKAIAFVRRAIEMAPGLGRGAGPLGHRAAAG